GVVAAEPIATIEQISDAAEADAEPDARPADTSSRPIAIPDRLPLALGAPLALMSASGRLDMPPYESAREHIDELVDLMAARAGGAIAAAWQSGRLSSPAEDSRPFEREVLALLGTGGNLAPDLLAKAEQRLAELSQRVAARASATIAAGQSLPLLDLVREMQLS